VVHDLGNLIQIASSAINIVARNPDMPVFQSGHMLSRANASLESAGDLVRQTMKLIRDRSTSYDHCDVAACLTDLASLVDSMVDANFSVELDVEPDLPRVRCNALGLRSAILNLVFNARDAMSGGGIVLIEAEAIGDGVYMVELRVIDTGAGMTREVIDRAFDPFFTTKSDGLGGIGLPMVDQFIRNSGGEISIDSEPGVGTTVRLRLPMTSSTSQPGLSVAPASDPKEQNL
jgi:signal transduction histidine kinase